MQFDVPILLLIYNRLEETRQVFEAIREVKPARLYIACDGPKALTGSDHKKVIDVREYVMANIDWDCETEVLFRDNNLGCRLSVSDSITWFFSKVEMGIILEDDCLPSADFFGFCREMLLLYKDDQRVWHVDGTLFTDTVDDMYDYHFSKYQLIWGWATWKRAWDKYDVTMPSYPEFRKNGLLRSVWKDQRVVKFWQKKLDDVCFKNFDTWDYQWFYTVWSNNGLSVRPNKNLIRNIGFSGAATHTKKKHKLFENMVIEKLNFPLRHPIFCVQDEEEDEACSTIRFNIRPLMTRLVKKVF